MNHPTRQKEVIEICLQQFMKKGLYKTSIRDLGNALNMESSGLYYYFKGRDEIVVACAEEAGIRMETMLILPVLDCIDNAENAMETAEKRLEKTEPMMKFFAQVCTTGEYREAMQPVLDRMKKRHAGYAKKFAERLNCEQEEIEPYLAACVALVANRMIFGEDFYYVKPFQLIADAIQSFQERKQMKSEANK